MEQIQAVIADLASIHGVSIPQALFDHATSYTTEEYRSAFAARWGYEVRAIGILLPEKQWQELQALADIPRHFAAQEYLPNRCDKCKDGFVLIKENQKDPRWNKDHEMLHFAQYGASSGFRELVKRYDEERDVTIAMPRIEAEMLYEVCAFRDNVSLGIPGKDWAWAKRYLIDQYLPAEIMLRGKEVGADLTSATGRMARELESIITIVESSSLSPAEMTACFFGIAYNSPFVEFRQRVAGSHERQSS